MEYRIKAHPTRYAGIEFRSRLEATWAAFFDQLGWQWSYEPIDLNGWVPDFAINGALLDLFVEVKPTRNPEPAILDKMVAAAPESNLLWVGREPVFDQDVPVIHSLGFHWCPRYEKWKSLAVVDSASTGRIDVHLHPAEPYLGFHYGEQTDHLKYDYSAHPVGLRQKWKDASNITRWRPTP